MEERLQKILASRGYGSRRVCEELIDEGRVSVDGKVVTLGAKADPETSKICVDGAAVATKAGLVHYLLNKPDGYISSASDPHGRKTVVELVPSEPRVYPVGRLDLETEGLLLLTNNGDLALQLTHPRFGVEKEYVAHVDGNPTRGALAQLRKGVELDDGLTAPAKVSSPMPGVLKITIHEGRNRQVRRMCEAVGLPVIRLVRTRIGPLQDKNLAPGKWRELTDEELRKLSEAAHGAEVQGKDSASDEPTPQAGYEAD